MTCSSEIFNCLNTLLCKVSPSVSSWEDLKTQDVTDITGLNLWSPVICLSEMQGKSSKGVGSNAATDTKGLYNICL